VSRLPVRLRLTLAFAVAMAVVLCALGGLLYLRVAQALQGEVETRLRVRAATLSALVNNGNQLSAGLSPASEREFAQLLRPDGSLVEASNPRFTVPLISAAEAAQARKAAFDIAHRDAPRAGEESARLAVLPVGRAGKPLVLVVGASLETAEDALDQLFTQLFVVGPAALLVASLAGYLLAAAALRPVEVMRRRASEISHDRTGQRLPLPPANDEIRRLGETLNAMLARLEAALARERRFVADASHELRTPLTLLRTELDLALRRPRSVEELRAALRSAAEEAERLSRLADDLLVLARVDEGVLPLQRSTLSSAELLRSVAGRFAARAETVGRTITVDAAGDPALVGDRLRLEQALGNLVDNALRHGAGDVRLGAQQHDGQVVLQVSDEGSGLPAEFLPHAFDRFTRAEAARSSAGTGLGLAIVAAIVQAHGGVVSARGGPHGGLVVSLTLAAAAGTASRRMDGS
jgi:two-component system OmpR family sensor kinase